MTQRHASNIKDFSKGHLLAIRLLLDLTGNQHSNVVEHKYMISFKSFGRDCRYIQGKFRVRVSWG